MVQPTQLDEPALRLLLIDDSLPSAERWLAALGLAAARIQWQRVWRRSQLQQALQNQTWDALLCRKELAGLAPISVLRLLRKLGLDLPCLIIATQHDDQETQALLQAGAHECFIDNQLERLLPAIQREIRYARHRADHRAALEMLRQSESRFRTLAANLPGMVFQLEYTPATGLNFTYVSEGCRKLLGLQPHELLTAPRRFMDVIDSADHASLNKALDDSASSCSPLNWEGRLRQRRRNQPRWINLRSMPQHLAEACILWQGLATDITRNKDAEAQLRHSREQLLELSDHLEGVKEEERERIARDIHDELGSTLVALKIEISLLTSKLPATPPLLLDKARTIEEMLNRAMSTVSRVARELRPGILKEFGLSAAIECQAEDFSQRTGITCRTQCEEDAQPLDESTALALFRIFQETLTNVAKHAHASLVAVRLRREKNAIVLEIRDNGRGISEADLNKPRSFGLRGIRERINSLNGEFTIGTADTGGSHLILSVPATRKRHETSLPAEDSLQQNLF